MSGLASHADVLTGSSRNHSSPTNVRGVGTRDEPLRTFAWEASVGYNEWGIDSSLPWMLAMYVIQGRIRIDWGSPKFGSERTVKLFCGKLLLTETTTCFSICEHWSPLAREMVCEQRRTDHTGGYSTTITFWNILGI